VFIVNTLIGFFNTIECIYLEENMIKIHLSRIMGEKRINIAELSRMTGLHRNGITKLYNEETDGVKFDTLDKICKALDCHVQDVIEYVEDDTN
jgi:putative transcriptional regulator